MKLSKNTIETLQNFSSINPSILVKPGNKLRTIAIEKNVFANVEIEETFDQEFAIYDLNTFLGAVSLFENPDLDFEKKHVTIAQGGNSCKYFFADPNVIVTPPKDDINLPAVDIQFKLPHESIDKLLKAASILGVEDIVIKSAGNKVVMEAADAKNTSSNSFTIELGDYQGDDFSASVKTYHINILPAEYDIEVSKSGISKWYSEDRKLNYYIAMTVAK